MLNHLLSELRFTDAIDIIATSILIYYTLLLIRGTRAVQILTGVLVLVGLLALANVAHLYLLGAILQLLVVGAAVTLPIVFQPELRRALEQIGRGGFFQLDRDPERLATQGEDPSLAEIVRAVFALARTRTGALVVLERQSGLKEFIESGTHLDALVSAELLVAIFGPRSPIHDGAVVVLGDRILAAGCFLPLAEQPLGERRLGTRHRAALGLSEQTDAVIVVVSEETGVISLARDGRISHSIETEARLTSALLAAKRRGMPRLKPANDIVSLVRARIFPARKPEPTDAEPSQELRA